ncbi:spore germination protein [Clostridium sp. 19966]|uniref:spore germination protein n=1 Tax=Clostridium sp. 19966 TaxID=2768166 RepID=UPI0028E29D7F|nr:spore germination protein [Clostridium sp. 19966]
MQERTNVYDSVDENLMFAQAKLKNISGFSKGKFKTFQGKVEIGIAFIENICDKDLVNSEVIYPLIQGDFEDYFSVLAEKLYTSSINSKKTNQMQDIITELLKGNTAVFFEKSSIALIIQSRKIEKRAIDKPENEITVYAAKEAFVEDIDTNISMIIRRLPIQALQTSEFTAGKLSNTNLKLLWIKDLASDEVIGEVKKRLNNVDTDMVDGASTLIEFIQDKPNGIFPTCRLTERPDMTARALSAGYAAIICDNSPFALIVPMSFWDNFKTMDDYSQFSYASSMLRVIRVLAFFISITISPLYLAFVTYNHTIVPPSLALNISQGREGVPFPSIIELMAMTIVIDIIREAGTRMPGIVGYFIGTLGAVIIGQAAVAAGYVSVSLIIVVAFSAIASFAISSTTLVNTSRIINYILILLSGLMGIFGFFNGIAIFLWRMVTLESFGVPYLYPILPVEFQGWKDVFIRAPFKALKYKLRLISNRGSGNAGGESK